MRTLIPLVFAFCCSTSSVLAQSPLNDAVKLSRDYEKGQVRATDSVLSILQPYVRAGASANEIQTAFLKNPFFKVEGTVQAAISVSPSSALSYVGGLEVTTLVDGFSKFLIKRAREELNASFFESFKAALQSNDDLKTLFPQTTDILSAFDISYYASFLAVLRQAFHNDLQEIYGHISTLIEKKKDPELFQDSRTRETVLALLDVAEQVSRGKHPTDILAKLEKRDFKDEGLRSLHATVGFARFVSQAFQTNEPSRLWVSRAEFDKGMRDSVVQGIFLGLLYQQAGSVVLSADGKTTLQTVFRTAKNTEETVNQLWSGIKMHFDVVQEALDSIRAHGSRPRFEDLNSYAQGIVNFMKFGNDFVSKISGTANPDQLNNDREKIKGTLRTMNTIYLSAKTGGYALTIVNIIRLLDSTLAPGEFKYKSDLLRYGTFVATVAEASTPDEVESALEAAVLPVGSSSIKRHARWDISLNSYLGGFLGNETISSAATAEKRSTVYGLIAPIGITISTPVCKSIQEFVTLSVFVTFIDVGAITAYRTGGDSVSTLPQVKLENLFAPGVYGILNFSGAPVSMGVGYQRGPNLRNISAAGANIEENTVSRVSVFLAVDIPLFNFYTKPW